MIHNAQYTIHNKERGQCEMTPAEKARETRKKHQEAQKAKEAENRELKAKLKECLISVVESKEAKPAEKLEASKLLMKLV